MKLRSALLLLPAVAGLLLGTLAPVQAAPTDPVTGLSASIAQTPGSNTGWTVAASWDANAEVTAYSVVIADHADGTVTSGKSYGNRDTASTSAQITSENLVAGQTYWVAVQPIAPALGEIVTAAVVPPALDTTAPSGTYQLNRTAAYLEAFDPFEGTGKASFTITQTSVEGDPVTRTVIPGDGSGAIAWSSARPFVLTYDEVGTYVPRVRLSDEFGNTRDVVLATVRVRDDNVAPKITITRPAKPGKVASWRVIRGTASDVGVGVEVVASFVIQKRGAIWWAYDFATKKWLKGKSKMQATLARSKATPAVMTPDRAGLWRTPALRRLTKGPLHVEAIAVDGNFNTGLVKVDQRLS